MTGSAPPDTTSAESGPDLIRDILTRYRRVAVVGLSPNATRASHRVAAYLRDDGYDITPVNPNAREVLGIPAASSLADAATRGPLEIVDIFRREDALPRLVDDAIGLGARVIWMQLGLRSDEAAERARAAGLVVVQDRCIKIEHSRLFGTQDGTPGWARSAG